MLTHNLSISEFLSVSIQTVRCSSCAFYANDDLCLHMQWILKVIPLLYSCSFEMCYNEKLKSILRL